MALYKFRIIIIIIIIRP